jgi:hypothetical protein
MTSRFVYSVQSFLSKEARINPGPLDGILGSQTIAAWNKFLDVVESKPTVPPPAVPSIPDGNASLNLQTASRRETNGTVKQTETGKGMTFLKRVGYSDIHTLTEDGSAFFYESGMEIDADGAPRAYHPNNKSGLDLLINAGKPGKWWALVTDNGRPSGRPVIQTAKDPAPGFYISTTTLEDKKADRRDPRRYVNAEEINFIVLPGGLNLGAKLGDFAVVIRPETGAIGFAIYADVGPPKKIGEASIAAANTLGIASNPKNGGIGHGIIYIVFRGSTGGWPVSQKEIDQQGAELFANWGGKDKAKYCFPDRHWPDLGSCPNSRLSGSGFSADARYQNSPGACRNSPRNG